MVLANGAFLLERAPCKSGRGFIVLAKWNTEYVTWWQVDTESATLSGSYHGSSLEDALACFARRTTAYPRCTECHDLAADLTRGRCVDCVDSWID